MKTLKTMIVMLWEVVLYIVSCGRCCPATADADRREAHELLVRAQELVAAAERAKPRVIGLQSIRIDQHSDYQRQITQMYDDHVFQYMMLEQREKIIVKLIQACRENEQGAVSVYAGSLAGYDDLTSYMLANKREYERETSNGTTAEEVPIHGPAEDTEE